MTKAESLRIGLEVGKVAGISDGIARYAGGLLRALDDLDEGHRLMLHDLSVDRLATPTSGGPDASMRSPGPADIDVFHATGFALPAESRVPLVVTIHDLSFITHPECHTPENRVLAVTQTARAIARRATFIAVSGHTRRELVEILGVSPERVSVVYEAPDAAFQPLQNGDSADALPAGVGPHRPYVLTVGSLEPRKNLMGALAAMEELPAARRRELSMVIVGPSGWRNRDIRQRLERARKKLDIHEVGYVSTRQLVTLYRHAAAFVYPSLSEGFGLPVIEAMACGTPVVASNRASLPEVAGDAASLVDPDDPSAISGQLDRLLGDPDHRGELVRRGFENTRRFSWQKCARETVAVYRRAVEEGRRQWGS